MNRFVLYEEVVEGEEKKFKLIAQLVKFRNGKVAASFEIPIPSVFVYDNLDQFISVYCNDKVKLQLIDEKKE